MLIPLKSAVTTYGTLFFAPYVFVGVAAADYLSGVLQIGSRESPCLQNEKLCRKKMEKSAPPATPDNP